MNVKFALLVLIVLLSLRSSFAVFIGFPKFYIGDIYYPYSIICLRSKFFQFCLEKNLLLNFSTTKLNLSYMIPFVGDDIVFGPFERGFTHPLDSISFFKNLDFY